MSDVLKVIRLNHDTLKMNYKAFSLAYVLAILLGMLKQPPLTIAIVTIISVTFCGMIFSIYEKNNLNKLYGILPLGRFEVVFGRYLFALLFGVINELVSSCLAYLIAPFTKHDMSQIALLTYLSGAFLYFCLAISISFPIYWKFGFSKSYLLTILPLYIVFISGILISLKTNAINDLTQLIHYFSSHQYMIVVTGIGLGLILLLLSCYVSYRIYRKSEL